MAKRLETKIKEVPHESSAYFCKWFRTQRDLSQRALASLIGVHFSAIGNLESNTYTLPTELMFKIYKQCNMKEKKFLLECLHNDLERIFFED